MKNKNTNTSKTIKEAIEKHSETRFVSEEEEQSNQEVRNIATNRALALMDEFGDSGKELRQVEFFFFADRIERAHQLANRLRELGYDLDVRDSTSSSSRYSVNGCTKLMKIDNDTMISWSEEMTKLGVHCDCKFDGWGMLMDL